jgi:hypothetical protein
LLQRILFALPLRLLLLEFGLETLEFVLNLLYSLCVLASRFCLEFLPNLLYLQIMILLHLLDARFMIFFQLFRLRKVRLLQFRLLCLSGQAELVNRRFVF